MHEYTVKLELKEGVTQTQTQELQASEQLYNKLMKDLTDMKALKKEQSAELAQRKQETAKKMAIINEAND
jgi:peptidoglycan hydrolase CwlO-like protein